MQSLVRFLQKSRVKKILLVFPHTDDAAYVSGGLLQLAQKLAIKTKLICLTGFNTIQNKELEKSSEILGVDEVEHWSFQELKLRETKTNWLNRLKKEIEDSGADMVISFDFSGITGHPDHIVVTSCVLQLLKSMKKKPLFLWRVPDLQESGYFKDNTALAFAEAPTHILEYSLSESVKKIKAIFAHRTKMRSFSYKLQILEWFLFDHKELYYKVDLGRKYSYKFVFYTKK